MPAHSPQPTFRARRGLGALVASVGLVAASFTLAPGAIAQTDPTGPAASTDPATTDGLTPPQVAAVEGIEAFSGAPVEVTADATTGLVDGLLAAPDRALGPDAGSATASASSLVDRQAVLWGDPDLVVTDAAPTMGGGTSVRFQQTVEGVPVLGGEVIVSLDHADQPTAVLADVAADPDVAVSPTLTAAQARAAAIDAAAAQHGLDPADLDASAGELFVYNPVLLGGPGPDLDRLVWRVEITASTGTIRDLILIDADLGFVALHIDQLAHALDRSVCDNNNVPGPVNTCAAPSARDEGDLATGNAQIDTVYDYTGDTYDFYFDRFGLDSIDGDGFPLISTVRFCNTVDPCPYANAFWNGQQMHYGDGYASADDVVAHEISHGVTEHHSGLFYWYESGSINEALSDIFGELVDLTNGAGNDTAGVRWLLGEDFPGGSIRDMEHPPTYADPDRMHSPNYHSATSDNGGVHTNSGVANKAAFLMTDGGTFNGQTITALGVDKSAAIWFNTSAHLLTSAADYADLDLALVAGCHDLIGTDAITATDCTEVAQVTDATEMHLRPNLAGQQVQAPTCAAGTNPTFLFDDDLEDVGSGNWTIQPLSGTTHWVYPTAALWGGPYATSGTTSAAGYGSASAGTSAFAMTGDVLVPAGSRLWFARAYEFQSGSQDGMVVEYSTTAGASWLDAGALFTENGYTGTIAAATNPLNGRSAFTGTSRGYASSRLDLSSLAGQNVRFRFRIGTDASTSTRGAFIDDVRIFTCAPTSALLVTSTADTVDAAPGNGICADAGAQCTLRAAVQEANALAGPNEIVLPASAHFTLSLAGINEGAAATGDLDVTGPLTIRGNDSVIDGAGLDRVIHAASQPVTLERLTITGGDTDGLGGGLYAGGGATLTDVDLSGNHTDWFGGGAIVGGTLTMVGGRVAGNTAQRGAGLTVLGALDVDGTVIEQNTASSYYGGVVVVGTGPATFDDAVVRDNQATGHGGGMALEVPVTITDSTISGNTALGASGFGGGLLLSGAATVQRTEVVDNAATLFGGIGASSTLTLERSTIVGNSATTGFGGLGAVGPAASVTNSTISGNVRGGIGHTTALTLHSSTVTANTLAPGLYTLGAGELGAPGGTSTVTNSIVSGNAAGDCGGLGPVTSGGDNVSAATSCGFTQPGDQQSTDPLLLPLADNGGPTRTHEVQPASPALGTGAPSCPATDQRGIARPQSGACDSGAVESYGATVDLGFVVDTTADAPDADLGDLACETSLGECSLRAAVMQANAVDGSHTITLQAATTYPLTRVGSGENQAVLGDLDLRADVTLVGNGATVDANDLDRVFQVHSPATAALLDVTVTDGYPGAGTTSGGGIEVTNGAALTLDGATVTANTATFGGGLYNSGTTTIVGGSHVDGNSAATSGGGLYSYGALTVGDASTTISDNVAQYGGGMFIDAGGPAVITDATIDDNTASVQGGGVNVYTGSTATFDGAVVSNNDATTSGATSRLGGGIYNNGTLTLTDSTLVSGNTAGSGAGGTGYGGGVFNNATLVVEDGTDISSNTAGVGAATGYSGGIQNQASLTVTDATVRNNSADYGGGILNTAGDTVTVTRSTVSGNTVTAYGGGLYNSGTATVEDSTFSANTAAAYGGAIMGFGPVTVNDSTITQNAASGGPGTGSGVYVHTAITGTFGNSIISANTGTGGDCAGPGSFATNGYNYRGSTCALNGTGDVNGATPQLGALANNGGPTQTHLPQVGSPVIGTGNPACAGSDQRGLARPQSGTCDIGAVDR